MDAANKKALIIVDVQPSFLDDRNGYIVENILKLLNGSRYDLYVEATFHAERGSLWDKQQGWICPEEGDGTETVGRLSEALRPLDPIKVRKETKSVFRGDRDLSKIFADKGVGEVHVVGLDTNDCVLATAYESFDLGFITYVIAECCQSSSSDRLHAYAIELLDAQDMICWYNHPS
ncbi:MAG: cysteine hydrolase [Patescibacteria group bacterium]|nr:cysteine hydrolase [Patescibacteria group bacterium]